MYFFTLRKTIIGKMLHVSRFTACENKLGHPLPNDWRELEAVPTDRKLLFPLDFLTLQRLVRYYSMKKDTISIFGSCTLIELYQLDRQYLIRLVAVHHVTEI